MRGTDKSIGCLFVFLIIIGFSSMPKQVEAFNPIQKYLIDPLAKIWGPWFNSNNTAAVYQINVVKTEENISSSTLSLTQEEGGHSPNDSGNSPVIIQSAGLSTEEVESLIFRSLSSLPSPTSIQNVTNTYFRTGSSDGLANAVGKTVATIQSDMDTLETNVDGLLSTTWPYTAQSWGVSTSTTLGLLNGFLSTASSTQIGDFKVLSGNLGVGTSSPFATLSVNNVAGTPGFTVGSTTGTSFIVDKNGKVGIGTSNPQSMLTLYNSDHGLASVLVTSSLTDSAIKTARFGTLHYTNSEEPFLPLVMNSGTNNNVLYLGGGSDKGNAATSIQFYTATNQTTVTGTERMRIQDDGNVGIGDTAPGNKFVVSQAANTGTIASFTDGTRNLTIYTGQSGNSYGGIGMTSSHDLRIFTANSPRMIITSGGNVGIGTTSPWRSFAVNSTVAVPGIVNDSTGYYACVNTSTGQLATSTTACGASSIKYKENVEDIKYGLNEVIKLKPVSFDYKDSYIKDAPHQIGFIAEEVDPIIPEVVSRDQNGEIQGLDYPKFVSVLVKAIQEINTKIDNGIGELKNLVLDSLSSTEIYTKEISADKINVKGDICVNNTCITRDQFEQMILRSGVGAVQISQNNLQVTNDDNQTGTSTDDQIEPTATSTDPIATTTSEVIVEETATSTTP